MENVMKRSRPKPHYYHKNATSDTVTVDQINADRLFDIAMKYWSVKTQGQHAPFDASLINYIYSHEILRNHFSSRRMSMLELSLYFDLYLWPNYNNTPDLQQQQQSHMHILSIVALLNEKFRQRTADAWRTIRQNPTQFPALFDAVLHLIFSYLDEENPITSNLEMVQLVQFLSNCIISLQEDVVRECVQKLFGFFIWSCLPEPRLQKELEKRPQLAKLWQKLLKSDSKKQKKDAGGGEREKSRFYSHYMFDLTMKVLQLLKRTVTSLVAASHDDTKQKMDLDISNADVHDLNEATYDIRVLEKLFDLILECLSSLNTRRFYVFLLDEYHFVLKCRMILSNSSAEVESAAKVLLQLLQQIDVYMQFELSVTGADLPRKEVIIEHYDKVQKLQKEAFRLFPDKLKRLYLAPAKDIVQQQSSSSFRKLIEPIASSYEQLAQLAAAANIAINTNACDENDCEKLVAVMASYYALKPSPLEQLNAEPLYPTETILWNDSLIPSDKSDLSELSLVLPRLNLQFLSLYDYLMRNYYLFRLESAYEIRTEIEDILLRMKPWQSEHDGRTLFAGWARMGQPLVEFRIVDVAEARAGEHAPERVRGEFSITLDVRDDVRTEWENLRPHDVCFLLGVQAHTGRDTRLIPDENNVHEQAGLRFVRGCEIEGMLDETGKLIDDTMRGANYHGAQPPPKFTNLTRKFRVLLDPNQYYQDICMVRAASDNSNQPAEMLNPYQLMNIVMRRRPEANNFKAVLDTLRVLMNSAQTIVPDWLRDVLLGYGDPGSACWPALPAMRQNVLAFNDTFLDFEHLQSCFPRHKLELFSGSDAVLPLPPFKLNLEFLPSTNEIAETIRVEPYARSLRSPYPAHEPKRNRIRFTPTQTRAILSGMQPGLTVIVGPPGTGKTDVAVQIISNLYHNFPHQRTVIVTHSNTALNQIFEKLMQLDIDERHLLRLGHGEEALETTKDFSRYGRVDYVLRKRLELLGEVERLQISLTEGAATAATQQSFTCETANYFFLYQVRPRWRKFLEKFKNSASTSNVAETFPFTKFFLNAPQPLFTSTDAETDWKKAELCWRYIEHDIFEQLEEFRAFELLRNLPERARYLLIREAKIIAMTCTHAAIRRQDLVAYGFTYDNIIMEEAAQITEVETFVPLLLQKPEHDRHNRLKRWIMLGDHNQLPPIVQNKAFEKHSNMEQSLFTRFIRLGVPHVLLDAQGRARPALRQLYSWRYDNKLGDLPHVLPPLALNNEYGRRNAGFSFDFQLIDVCDFHGVGESVPSRHFVQNLAEAEFVVATFMYMRLLGYPAERITILATYQGQRQLIGDVVQKRCADNPVFGEPARISTVDKYQGQQNDYILLSMVRTSMVGYLRDVRRVIVALSRARLGLYVFARARLFLNCYETAPAFEIMARAAPAAKLNLLPNERWTYNKEQHVERDAAVQPRVVNDMPDMVNFVGELYEKYLREEPEKMLELFAEHEKRKREVEPEKQAGGTDAGEKAVVPFYELSHDVKRRKRQEQAEQSDSSAPPALNINENEIMDAVNEEMVEEAEAAAAAKVLADAAAAAAAAAAEKNALVVTEILVVNEVLAGADTAEAAAKTDVVAEEVADATPATVVNVAVEDNDAEKNTAMPQSGIDEVVTEAVNTELPLP